MASKHLWKTKLTANDSTAQEELGILRREWDSTDSCFKTYRYVKTASDTTVANGTALAFVAADTLQQTVSSDATDFNLDMVAGVGIGAITASYMVGFRRLVIILPLKQMVMVILQLELN